MFVSARKLLDIALVACVVYPGAQCAFGQTIRPAGPAAGQVAPGRPAGPNQTFDRDARHDENRLLQGSVLIGAPVMLQGGASWGSLRDFVISDSGCLEYAVISADNGLVAVPWNAGMFDGGRHAFMLNFGRDRIRDLPRIRDVAELRDPKFQQRVHTFFRGNNNTPGARDQRGTENRENQPRGTETQPQNRGTVRGAAPHQPQQGTPRPANNGTERGERRER